MEWNTILSILALAGSIYTYIAHTKRLNAQQKKINEYQIEKIEKENLLEKQANIKASFFRSGDSWKLRIYNDGLAEATNVQISPDKSFEDGGIVVSRAPSLPYKELISKASFDINIILISNHDTNRLLKFTWDDKSGKNRSTEQNVTFN